MISSEQAFRGNTSLWKYSAKVKVTGEKALGHHDSGPSGEPACTAAQCYLWFTCCDETEVSDESLWWSAAMLWLKQWHLNVWSWAERHFSLCWQSRWTRLSVNPDLHCSLQIQVCQQTCDVPVNCDDQSKKVCKTWFLGIQSKINLIELSSNSFSGSRTISEFQ